MTITSTASEDSRIMSAAIKDYPIGFPIIDEASTVIAEIMLQTDPLSDWLIVPQSEYSLEKNPDSTYTFKFNYYSSPFLRENWTLRLTRTTKMIQPQAFTTYTRYGDATESGLDRLTLEIQEINRNSSTYLAAVETNLASEVSRATAAEQALGTRIDGETQRALTREEELRGETEEVRSLLTNGISLEHEWAMDNFIRVDAKTLPTGGTAGQVLMKTSPDEPTVGAPTAAWVTANTITDGEPGATQLLSWRGNAISWVSSVGVPNPILENYNGLLTVDGQLRPSWVEATIIPKNTDMVAEFLVPTAFGPVVQWIQGNSSGFYGQGNVGDILTFGLAEDGVTTIAKWTPGPAPSNVVLTVDGQGPDPAGNVNSSGIKTIWAPDGGYYSGGAVNFVSTNDSIKIEAGPGGVNFVTAFNDFIPEAPDDDGDYILTAKVVNNKPTYSWQPQTPVPPAPTGIQLIDMDSGETYTLNVRDQDSGETYPLQLNDLDGGN